MRKKIWVVVMWDNGCRVTCSNAPWKSGDWVFDTFLVSLRVFVVDDNSTCLMILEKKLRTNLYESIKSMYCHVHKCLYCVRTHHAPTTHT